MEASEREQVKDCREIEGRLRVGEATIQRMESALKTRWNKIDEFLRGHGQAGMHVLNGSFGKV